ncbi:MAG: hypothetical protein R3229_03110, partial [Alphaproteobacteria bacterium]|nr:hypothetical protein [Alphaproteobacteria bacterium]
WDRATDTFTHGQWFHGRVYERRCDLSPNGEYFIYFAAKHGRAEDTDDIGEAWTAISRPPYFTALTLWTNIGSWYGGGVFKSDKRVMLDATCTLTPHPRFKTPPLRIEAMGPETAPWEQRLLRDQWVLVERGFDPRTHRRIGAREIWEKPHPKGAITLCREVEDVDFQRYGGFYGDVYWLEAGAELIPLDGVSWAEWDDWEHIVMVADGRLFRAAVTAAGLGERRELLDFNPLRPEQLPPPDWARKW